MNRFDVVLAIIILIGTIRGYKKGFLLEITSFAAIVVGVLAGFTLMHAAIELLEKYVELEKLILPYLAFALVFVVVVFLVSLLGKAIKDSMAESFLGRVDQAVGAIVGVFKMTFMISVILWILNSLKIKIPDDWTQDSLLYKEVCEFAPTIARGISSIIPVFKGIF